MPGPAQSSPASPDWQGRALAEEVEVGSPSQPPAGLPRTPIHERLSRGSWGQPEGEQTACWSTHALALAPRHPAPSRQMPAANVRASD